MMPAPTIPSRDPNVWRLLLDTPLGPLVIRGDRQTVQAVDFAAEGITPLLPHTPLACEVRAQLERYFRVPERGFDLPLRPEGTDFQQRVWRALRAIPCGEVRRYGEIARALGTSARAVGNACRRNPLPVLVPCHRVVGAHGLGGYDGSTGGLNLEIKRWLLRHEGALAAYE